MLKYISQPFVNKYTFNVDFFYLVYSVTLNNNKYGTDVNIKNMYSILLKFKHKNKMEYISLCK